MSSTLFVDRNNRTPIISTAHSMTKSKTEKITHRMRTATHNNRNLHKYVQYLYILKFVTYRKSQRKKMTAIYSLFHASH